MLVRGLGASFEVPSIYVTGPNGIEATSNDRIIQRGDILMIDFGVGYLNMWTDQKRIAYVLEPGEVALPASYQERAFDQAVKRARGDPPDREGGQDGARRCWRT
jgi:Xaa-Pro aminopeptidase